jgi:hypothetical protein
LSDEETREILTLLAFKIDKSLFGISLAVPPKHGTISQFMSGGFVKWGSGRVIGFFGGDNAI